VKKHIPNALTSGNLFLGCLAIIASNEGNPVTAAWFIIAAAVLDFLDGFVARLLKAHSEIGKQLDYANALGIPFALIAGENEVNSSSFSLKNLVTGVQSSFNLEELIHHLLEN